MNFFFNDTATTEIYTLSLHDALPISRHAVLVGLAPHRLELRLDAGDGVEDRHGAVEDAQRALHLDRSEEHTSELQSRQYLVCRLLLENKKDPTLAPPPLYLLILHTSL